MEFHLIQFLLMTLTLFGWCSYQLGKAMANTWQPISLMIFYVLLLTAFDRFLLFALFEQELLSVIMFFIDFITLSLIALISYRIAKITYMVSQYPWKYKKKGFFSYKNK
tara:strand:+ start:270 stop:596 length:327 start_codon:yes stop_codon:yes gene_type:complete